MDLNEFINKKQGEAIHIIKEDLKRQLKRKNKEFEFIKMFVKENHNEIMHYTSMTTSLMPSVETMYKTAKQVANLFIKDDGNMAPYLNPNHPTYNSNSLDDYLPIKLGFFKIEDRMGHLELTEKGKKIRKKYFEN